MESYSNIPTRLSADTLRRLSARRGKQLQLYVRGPIPLWWLEKASTLPGKAVQVSMVLWFLAGIHHGEEFKLKTGELLRLHVDRKAAYVAIKGLERLRLISVKRHSGRCHLIKVIGARSEKDRSART